MLDDQFGLGIHGGGSFIEDQDARIGEQGARKVRELLDQRGLSSRVKLVVGGAPYRFDETLYRRVGADGWAADGIAAGRMIIDLIRSVREGAPA